jgi:Zn-dependent protease with chaperone function
MSRFRQCGLLGLSLALLIALPASGAEPLAVPAPTAEALAYHRGQDLFWLADQALGFIVPIIFLFAGWSAGLSGWARRVTGGRWYPALALYGALYILIVSLIELPMSYAHDYVFAHAYDQSNQTLAKWGGDQAIGLAVQLVVVALVIWIPFLLIRRSPKRWWLWSSAALTPVFILGIVVWPIWIAPLFNTFTPLPDSDLKTKIEAEAARVGLKDATILVMDQSTDSKTIGAYVTGIAGSERIVLYDTTLKTLDAPETLFVVAHEMKHYLLNDVWKLVGLYAGVMLVGFFVVDRLARSAIHRWRRQFGFTDLADPAALPLILAVFGLASLAATPLLNAATRSIEHEADRFALELTQDNHAATAAFIKRQTEAMGVPYPGWLERTFRLDHPSLGERITFANDYHPWDEGTPLVYGDRMKAGE